MSEGSATILKDTSFLILIHRSKLKSKSRELGLFVLLTFRLLTLDIEPLTIHEKKGLIFSVLVLVSSQVIGQDPTPEQRAILSVERIWNRAGHNAFTDLILFQDKFYCAFREGSRHSAGVNGTARIIVSEDGQFEKAVTLPSGGDTSYPGLVLKDDILYVSYYSGHEGKTAIYLAKIWWERL